MLKFVLDSFMKENHLSIQDVVNATGISRPTISQLSNGKSKGIQFETLDRLVSGLGIDMIDDLFEDELSHNNLNYFISLRDNYKNFLGEPTEPILTVPFYLPENSTDEFTVVSFKMPLSVEFNSSSRGKLDTIIFACYWDSLDDLGLPTRSQFNLQSYLSQKTAKQLELMLGKILSDCLNLLKLNTEYTLTIFKTDVTLLPNETGTRNFSWPTTLITNKSIFSNFVNLKYD